jgi:hypothetical protein
MIDLGGSQQSFAPDPAAMTLCALEQAHLLARRIPELPCDHTGRVPGRVPVGSCSPEIAMPSETVHGLAADTAMARTKREGCFTIRCWRRPERGGQASLVRSQPPTPTFWSTALRRESAREPVGAQRMRSPVAINREARRRRDEALRERVSQYRTREDCRQRAPKPGKRALVFEGTPIRTLHRGHGLLCADEGRPARLTPSVRAKCPDIWRAVAAHPKHPYFTELSERAGNSLVSHVLTGARASGRYGGGESLGLAPRLLSFWAAGEG